MFSDNVQLAYNNRRINQGSRIDVFSFLGNTTSNVRERNIEALSRNHYCCGKAVSTANSGLRGGALGWVTALQGRKVAGSIPDGVMEIFHWFNPSGHTKVLGST